MTYRILAKRAASALGFTALLFSVHVQAADSILTYKGSDRTAKLVAGAKKEKKLTVYSALTVNQALRPLTEGFKKKYPFVETEFWRGSSRQIAKKVNAEIRANSLVADVLEGSGLSQIMVKARGVVKFTTPLTEGIDKKFLDPNDQWIPSRFSYFGTAYNTKIIPTGTQPKTYDDLLNPKWKGKIAWRIGSETGALLFITNVRQILGDKKAEVFFQKLSAQGLINFRGSARTLVNRVVQGEYPLAIQIFAHHPVISAKKGAPVATQMMEPVVSVNGTIMLPKGVKNPHTALLFVDYYLSKEGQEVLKKARYFPVAAGVKPRKELAPLVPALSGVKENFVSPATLFANRKASTAVFNKYFKSGKTVTVKSKKKKKKKE
ncbi:MAG: extracellular solute-binding protein [Rhodospirillaceae bacterium]